MTLNRSKVKKTNISKPMKSKDLCSGPSKLCQALSITKQMFNEIDMVTSDEFFVQDDGFAIDDKQVSHESYLFSFKQKKYVFFFRKKIFILHQM